MTKTESQIKDFMMFSLLGEDVEKAFSEEILDY